MPHDDRDYVFKLPGVCYREHATRCTLGVCFAIAAANDPTLSGSVISGVPIFGSVDVVTMIEW